MKKYYLKTFNYNTYFMFNTSHYKCGFKCFKNNFIQS